MKLFSSSTSAEIFSVVFVTDLSRSSWCSFSFSYRGSFWWRNFSGTYFFFMAAILRTKFVCRRVFRVVPGRCGENLVDFSFFSHSLVCCIFGVAFQAFLASLAVLHTFLLDVFGGLSTCTLFLVWLSNFLGLAVLRVTCSVFSLCAIREHLRGVHVNSNCSVNSVLVLVVGFSAWCLFLVFVFPLFCCTCSSVAPAAC